ncbi:hypothetical protein [Microbacterium sp. zg-YB36]|uniref:hypothetical protein n=1 Tax=Microbacterium sp. zg-YB36 TaxID=2969407 RepID=UPI00214C5D7C|nr:hypothetical protein [Microbacterium sp. zg-YB36]MDL5350431.1 hypothetical protein [Microbacterium sp. zg-YB36]
MSPRRLLVTVTAAAFALSLSACVPISTDGARPADDDARPSASAAPSAPGAATGGDCGGEPVTVSSGSDLDLSGDCPQVTLSGTDIELDLTRATVDELQISGDRHEVDAGDVVTVAISGQDNNLEATSVMSLELTGDRNEIDVRGEIGEVVVNGNDNEVDAGALGDVVDNGDRNFIVVDR